MQLDATLRRRDFLKAGVGAVCCASLRPTTLLAETPSDDGLIERIETSVIINGRQTGTTWFQPRGCTVADDRGNYALLAMQPISGSDLYGPVHWIESRDMGVTWSRPEPIPGLGRRDLGDGWEEGTCDVTPEFHPQTNTVLAVGHNVFYLKNVLAHPQRSRWPVYTVRSSDGEWTTPRKLEWNDPRGAFIYTGNCGQRVTLDNGRILFPLSFGPKNGVPRSVSSAYCCFDGERLTICRVGNELKLSVRRGLLEPSMVCYAGMYYITIRAEDNHGYVAVSDDGLTWRDFKPWAWDDGSPLVTSTTQQHWLPHSDGLFLVYTRKDASNEKVFRWRSPLYVAEVDRRTMRLIRASERIVFPLSGDAAKKPAHVAMMGNFHTQMVSPRESWITVGEGRPRDGWKGDTLLARVCWRQANRMW